jgi:hypothetical protein
MFKLQSQIEKNAHSPKGNSQQEGMNHETKGLDFEVPTEK